MIAGGYTLGAVMLGGERGMAAEAGTSPIAALADRLLDCFPELGVYFGTPNALNGGSLASRMDDWSVANSQALNTVLSDADKSLRQTQCDNSILVQVARAIVRNGLATAHIRYGRQNPLWFSGHIPYVIAPVAGPHIDTPGFMIAQQTLDSAAAVEAWIEKLIDFDRGFDAVCERLRHDEAIGCRPPATLLRKALPAIDAFQAGPADTHPMIAALRHRLEAAKFDNSVRSLAETGAITALAMHARPAYARLGAVVADLARRGSDADGVWAQPDGEALYAANVRALGDTELSPDDIHRLGLDEVSRINAEMDAALRRQGLSKGDVGSRMAALQRDQRFSFGTGDAGRTAILERARELIRTAEAHYPQILPAQVIPRSRLEVRRVAQSAESGASLAFADPPPLGGTGAGNFWLNLGEATAFSRLNLPTTVFHESVPGHFTAGAVASEAGRLPLLLKITSFNAFNEGWALYAEALMAELGAYEDDPWGNLGRLNDELWRAVRLVVDTGIHHRRWSRMRAIRYMIAATGKSEAVATVEVERYMAWPGQALGYKLGELRIRQLRRAAEVHLGSTFSLPQFHQKLLENASLPLDLVANHLRATQMTSTSQ